MTRKPNTDLRRGWTTGACATAATKAALDALWGNGFKKNVSITLPRGEKPIFPLAHTDSELGWAEAGITKDAGDDPDVTHGALIIVRVHENKSGIIFKAGEGVGIVTKAGLPIGVGEPAINPIPRQMMIEVVNEQASLYGYKPNLDIVISIPNGEVITQKTWNGRLGIVGGLSILGTTGIVRPFSCAAWIASIHRGVDVARANDLNHVAGCTGATSERIVQEFYGLSDHAMLDMGDFSGGLLKYITKNYVPKITIGGGIGKMIKLAQGAVDLHSSRSQVDFNKLNDWCSIDVSDSNTALEAFERAGNVLAERVAHEARMRVLETLKGTNTEVDIIVINRIGTIIGHAK